MPQQTEYPLAEVLERLSSAPADRKICLIEGVAGSGKSTFADSLVSRWPGQALHLSTDAFIRIPRTEWARRVEQGGIYLPDWYDLTQIESALLAFGSRERIRFTNLYNLANGQYDLDIEHITTDLDLLVIEGLFAFDSRFTPHAHLRVFLDLKTETAKGLARQRDLTERNLAPEAFTLKEQIYYAGYLSFVEDFRNGADIVLKRSE